ncbi:hypothetical protein I79_010048 [Cricetulus griseus]|uniref:Uncharacterized protein n=1 Tax=Cricetulus griseus TaxID=10029 RepID=G3HHE7_CRIGR|nr:hypothetical protein I79_010048 [Cricetulus griseus]
MAAGLPDRSTGEVTIKILHSLNAQLIRKHKATDQLSIPTIYIVNMKVFLLNKCIPMEH